MEKKFIFIFIFIFSFFTIHLENICSEESLSVDDKYEEVLTLKQIDVLIKNTEYDKALLELNKFFEKNPEQFDYVQARISKIMKTRDLYSVLASQLLKVIREEPENTEKLGRITERLVLMEHNPADKRLDIIKSTNTLAALAKYSLIQNETSALVLEEKFDEAIKRASDGFFIYKIPFNTQYEGKSLGIEVEKNISSINNNVILFSTILMALKESVKQYSLALSSNNLLELERLYNSLSSNFESLAKIRNEICKSGSFFDLEYKKTGNEKDEEYNQFLKYARDTIFGWQDNPDCGITGAIDATWNVYLEKVKDDSVLAINKCYENFFSKNNTFLTGEKESFDITYLKDVKEISIYSKKLNNLYSLLLNDDAKSYRKPYENYEKSIGYSDLLADKNINLESQIEKYFDIWKDSKLLLDNSSLEKDKYKNSGLKEGEFNNYYSFSKSSVASLISYYKNIEIIANSFLNDNSKNSILEKDYIDNLKNQNNSLTAIRKKTSAGIDIKDNIIDWSTFINSSDLFNTQSYKNLDSKCVLIWNNIADTYSVFGETLFSYSEEEQRKLRLLIDGEKKDGEDILRRYPSLSIQQNSALVEVINVSKKLLSDSLIQLDGKYKANYTNSTISIQNSIDKLNNLLVILKQDNDNALALLKSYQKTKNEADLRLSQARKALSSENFETARKRLQESSEKYVEALSYSDNESVRKESDQDIIALGNEIKVKENVLVVKEVRQLKNQARREYFNGNFQTAEKYLNTAKSRWADTNIEEDVEITNLLAIVDTALSMKTGRVMLPSDSLYPEMSQVLSIASQFYKQGSSLIKKGKKQEADEVFNKALQKLEELRLVYPLNQEASILTLRIQQLQNPSEFEIRFAEKIESVKNNYKDKDKQRQAYSDLLDLYEINPNYSGIKKLLYNVEIEVGVRQKPVQKNDILRSSSLFTEASRLYNVAGRDETKLKQALAKVDESIQLNSENNDAILLKDEISIRLGGNISVTLSAEDTVKYNTAIQELQNNNVLMANVLVEQLLQKKENKTSARILELQKRIKARM